ncbi:MAG: TAXI family TRAP transporter solute-binding subunit [Acidobacteriota bacterium]|nr:TAXI family TRAP transporter solute-binding subunit [Acidobacteriota bacterium]MDH3523134.1 TAXI family TRAP transporter solute-binding subunit [Acidobacteriota bacterium]
MIRDPRLAALSLVLAAGLALGGCGTAGDDGAGAPQARFLSIGTAPPGGAFFVVGGALAEVLDANPGAGGWQVTAESTKGTQENIRRLTRGELDFALANAAITYFAVRGAEGWERTHDVKSVMTLAPNVAFFIAPRGAGVETIADLAGRRVVVGPAGAGFEYFIRPILAAHGLTYDDFTPLHATQAAAVGMLGDGSAAAAFLGGAIPTASITQATTSQDIVFLPFAEEARERLLAEYPFFAPVTVPAGTYAGQEADFAALNVGSMQLVTAGGADEELVYQVTKTLYEHRAEVVERHPAGRAINPANAPRETGTPFHPGAERYYREIGIWPGSDDAAAAAGG